MSELNNTDPGNLSKFNSVFCDSTEALEWAYENRLPKSAIIKSSSPAMLWDCKPYVNNIESRWTIEKIKKFKDSLRNMTEEIFDTVNNIFGIYPIHNFNSECDSVKDIYKNLQPASYSSTTLMIENNKSFQMDFLKSAISLNKLLLNKQLDLLECSKPKGWFLGQLTIYTYPKKWKVLQLEFVRVVACKLFQTRVIIDGLEVAEILFVPKK